MPKLLPNRRNLMIFPLMKIEHSCLDHPNSRQDLSMLGFLLSRESKERQRSWEVLIRNRFVEHLARRIRKTEPWNYLIHYRQLLKILRLNQSLSTWKKSPKLITIRKERSISHPTLKWIKHNLLWVRGQRYFNHNLNLDLYFKRCLTLTPRYPKQ